MTKNEATAASTAARRRARTRSQLVLTPPLRRSLVETHRPLLETRPGGMEPQICQTRRDDDDEGHGDRSDARREHRHQAGADDALGRRSHGQRDPVRMLNVARVAMIEGILSLGSGRR